MRDGIKKHYIGMNKEFRFRGEEQTRIEALSDAGFALAIGLLLISTTSPSTTKELIEFTSDIVPFSICIALIMLVWYQHFIFFLRYGLRNAFIVVINTALIFIILFYVYPLKFLAKLIVLIYGGFFKSIFGIENFDHEKISQMIGEDGMFSIMTIYGLGAAAIFLLLACMYWYAYKNACELDLNDIELFDTKVSVISNILMSSIPLFSVLILVLFPKGIITSMFSGFTYFLYLPVMMVFAKHSAKKRLVLIGKDSS